MAEITADFTGLQPAQSGGSTFIHIPRGYYALKLIKIDPRTTDAGQRSVRIMVEVAQGAQEGAKLSDEFLLDPSGQKQSRFGAQRFMAFLLAAGVQVQPTGMKFEGDRLLNRILIGDVQDAEMKESKEKNPDGTPKYPARTISRPVAYYNPRALPPDIAAKFGVAAGAPAAAAAAPPAPAPAAPVADPPAAFEAAPAPSPAPVAVPAAPVASVPASVAQPVAVNGQGDVTQVAAEVDDLFGS